MSEFNFQSPLTPDKLQILLIYYAVATPTRRVPPLRRKAPVKYINSLGSKLNV